MVYIWAIVGVQIYWEAAPIFGTLWTSLPVHRRLSLLTSGLWTSKRVSILLCFSFRKTHVRTTGTYSIASGTTYEAEAGTMSGSARLHTDSTFSGGLGVGFLGNGGSLTISNVQGNGRGQWVSLYIANGDSSFRNTTIRYG